MLRSDLDMSLTAAPPVVALPPLPVQQPGSSHDAVLQLQAQVNRSAACAGCVSRCVGSWMRSRRA